MKAKSLCLPCTARTAHDVASRSTDDEEIRVRIILEVAKWLFDHFSLYRSLPTILHTQVCRIAREITGISDPFSDIKRISNEIALRAIPLLENEMVKLNDARATFRFAVKSSIIGNVIDFEVEDHAFRLDSFESAISDLLSEEMAVDDVARLSELLAKSKNVTYLLDNAGEIVFDKFLIKTIKENHPCRVCAVVKEGPVLNDATMVDAHQVDLDEVADDVITTGNDIIGVSLEESSTEFLSRLKTADLIIAKGQGHYESMTEIEDKLARPICYLLRAKCILVAQSLGVPVKANVAKIIP